MQRYLITKIMSISHRNGDEERKVNQWTLKFMKAGQKPTERRHF